MTSIEHKALLLTAFEIAAKNDGYAEASFEINGYHFSVDDHLDPDLLEVLALSPVREKLKNLRNMLNEALGPKEPDEEIADAVLGRTTPTPDEELRAAAAVFAKHVESGYLLDVDVDDCEVRWLKRVAA